MTRILAIDLGKFKSVACLYDAKSAQSVFQTLQTTPQSVHDLLVECVERGGGSKLLAQM